MRITYWGKKAKTMSWLDMPPCERVRCEGDRAGVAVISNLAVQGTPFSILTDKSTMTTTQAFAYAPAPGTESPQDDDLWNSEVQPEYSPMYPSPTPAPFPSQVQSPFSIQSFLALLVALISAAALLFYFCPHLFRRSGLSSHGPRFDPSGYGAEQRGLQRGAYGAQGAGVQDVRWAHPRIDPQHQGPFGGYGHASPFSPGQALGPAPGVPHPGQYATQGNFATQAQGFPPTQQGLQAGYPPYMGTTMANRPFATMAAGPL